MNELPGSAPSGGRIVLIVVALVAVVGAALWLLDVGSIGSSDAAERTAPETEVPPSVSAMVPEINRAVVGDCVAIVKGGVDAELDVVECGTPEARYTIAHDDLKVTEHCLDGPYVEYSRIGFGGWKLCLMLNATVGECFMNSVGDGPTLADCAAADLRVTAVLPDAADEGACPPQQAAGPHFVYQDPPRTICVDGI